jgi:hypothetical protein
MTTKQCKYSVNIFPPNIKHYLNVQGAKYLNTQKECELQIAKYQETSLKSTT